MHERFKGLLEDLTFKYVFSQEEVLKDFINAYFEYTQEAKAFGFAKIIPQEYIMPNKRKAKSYFGDIVATLTTGEIIIIEAYTYFQRREYKKSCSYLVRHYANQLKAGDEYDKVKKVTCLNLIYGNYKKQNNEIVNRYNMRHNKTFQIIEEDSIEMVLIRLDQIDQEKYNEEKRFIRWLKIINSKSIEEMETLAKGDKIMEQSIEYLKRYCGSELDHGFEDIIAYHEVVAMEKGEKKGKKEGLIEGQKIGEKRGEEKGKQLGLMEGYNEAALTVASKMLEDGVDEETIKKYVQIDDTNLEALKSK